MHQIKFLADECVFKRTINLLEYLGMNVERVQDAGLSGATDDEILAYAQQTSSILVTNDLDFSDIRVYNPSKLSGIIVLRIIPTEFEINKTHKVLTKLINSESTYSGKLFVVDKNKYRVRTTP